MMRPSGLRGPAMTPSRARLVKSLSLVAVFTFLAAFACGIWFTYTNGYSATVNLAEVTLIQLEPPQAGDPIAVMHTSVGDLSYRLYPSECPKAVENFVQLAESGYYDNTYVFRVEQGIFFAAGAPNPDGSLAEDVPNDAPQESVPRELSPNLWPLRGALCALTTKTEGGFFRTLTGKQSYYNGSRFLVADTIEMTEEITESLSEQRETNPVAAAFLEHGGIPNYGQQITIFGQLYAGFEVLDAITEAELTGETDALRPKEEIRILSIEIGVYTPES